MSWKKKKVYGDYKTSDCPFCGKIATSKNEQGLDVCNQHKEKVMDEIKCVCGSWLESRSGKFGPYYNCITCGNVNFQKAMSMKSMQTKNKNFKTQEKTNSGESNFKEKEKKQEDFLTMIKKDRLKRYHEKKIKEIDSNDSFYF